jgi:hypothetical protein
LRWGLNTAISGATATFSNNRIYNTKPIEDFWLAYYLSVYKGEKQGLKIYAAVGTNTWWNDISLIVSSIVGKRTIVLESIV